MKKRLYLTGAAIFLFHTLLLANNFQEVSSESRSGIFSGMDPFEITIFLSYVVGVLVLLPLVIYTNIKEGLSEAEESDVFDLSIDERNYRAEQILVRIEDKLTPFTTDDGSEMLTINKGSQAKFMKRGLDYINNNHQPSDPMLQVRIKEFAEMYDDRAQRAFTGSWWIIASSTAVGVLIFMSTGFSTFIAIHFLGLLFYILSSRTTMYTLEKRLKRYSYMPGFMNTMMSGLFIGSGTKYYSKSGGGPWKRDYETEGQMAIIGLFFMVIASLFLGFLAALLGVLNFLTNYSTSFLSPFMTTDKWYNNNFIELDTHDLETA